MFFLLEISFVFWGVFCLFSRFLRVRKVRKFLGVFEVFVGIFEKTKEKKDRVPAPVPPLFSKKAKPWGKKWPVQMNLPFFAVKAYVPGGVQNQAEKNSKNAFRPVPVQKFTFPVLSLVVRIARPASLAIWHRRRSHRRPNRSESPNRRPFASLDLKKHADFSHRRPTSQDFRREFSAISLCFQIKLMGFRIASEKLFRIASDLGVCDSNRIAHRGCIARFGPLRFLAWPPLQILAVQKYYIFCAKFP